MFSFTAAEERNSFMLSVCTDVSTIHPINRKCVYDDVLLLFENDDILKEFPLRISFTSEIAIDAGGVCREMFSAFWEAAYSVCCDGDSLLVPRLHPGLDVNIFTKLGTILSHGYLLCGFLPLRIAYPTLVTMLLGAKERVPDSFVMSAFLDSLNSHERGIVQSALKFDGEIFPQDLRNKLIAIISRFDGRKVPTPNTLKEILGQLANFQFRVKPLPAAVAAYTGIPEFERCFWESKTAADIHLLYFSLLATPAKVLASINEPECMNAAEERVFTYLTQMVGDMKAPQLATLLRFISGSSVVIGKSIIVMFNQTAGLARRPIAHTCDCALELSTSYLSYLDFEAEFRSILTDTEFVWNMNAL